MRKKNYWSSGGMLSRIHMCDQESLNYKGVGLRDWPSIARRWSGRGRIRTLVLLGSLFWSEYNPACQVLGSMLYLIGMALHLVAKGHLVRNEQLCRSGPYGWVRHPFYMANLLIDCSICITAGAVWMALCYLVVFPLAYLPRILAEEASLEARFGHNYYSYAQSVPRLLPTARLPSVRMWLRGISSRNLRNENEISRQLRLSAYLPLLHAAVVFNQNAWAPDNYRYALVVLLCVMSFVLWAAGELYHRIKEDA